MRNIYYVILVLGCMLLGVNQLSAQSDSRAQAPLVDYTNPKLYTIDQVYVHGVEFMNTRVLLAAAGISRGDEILIPGNYLSQAIEKLWAQKYFSDVSIETTIKDNDKVIIDIYLKELPRIFNWEFEGLKKSEVNNLREELNLKRGQNEFSDFVVNRYKTLIEKHFAEKGFLNTQVDIRVDVDSVLANSVNITYVVDKKNKVKVGEVVIEGNENLAEKRIKTSMKTINEKNWMFWKSSKFKEADFATAKENIIDYYNSKGYRNATIVSDSIYDINEKRMGISIKVEEGNKYYFRNISWVGNSKYSTDELNSMVRIRTGDTYDKQSLDRLLGIGKEGDPEKMSVSSLYQNNGYLFFQIDPAETIVGADSIDLTLKIIEGKPATVNEVNISGNMRVNDEVIRRELSVRPGELYNRALLMQTLRQLSQMGHFNPEYLQPDINPITNELVNISFPLQEQASDKFELSGGWGSGMFIGSIGVQLTNLSIKELFKKDAWRPYPQGQGQQLSVSAQTNGTYYKSFSLSFTEPWVGGKKPNSLTVSAHYSDENNAYYVWESGTEYFRTYGVAAGLGRRLSWPDRNFTIYNELAYQRYELEDWSSFVLDNGSANIISFKTVLSRNSVDQMIYPRSGSDFTASLEFTPPYSLFDGKDYSDDDMSDQDRYKWIEYHKWMFSATWYTPISRNNKLVLMTRAEMGILGSYNSNKLSPFEGFDVGGDGMSSYSTYGVDVIGLRGYESSALNPYSESGDYARAYNKYVAELRYPVVMEQSSTIYVLAFAEAGNAFSSWNKFDPFLLKRSLGVGVRLYLPVVGMVGIDWGYGFDPDVSSGSTSGGQLHFIIGTSF